ncbi:MAG TPA: ABC transporter permease [Bacteroidia bacterium]|nr:ABC transporter permease [Bacteroidia bacterium]
MIIDRDSFQEIFATIKKNKLRTALTMLGVGWGIFMLVIMLGCGNGLKNGVLRGFDGIANNAMFIWTQQTTKPYKGLKPGRRFIYNNADFVSLKKMNDLELVCPRVVLESFRQGNNVVRGLHTGSFQVIGDVSEVNRVQKIKISKGRFLNHKDISDKRKNCVIGTRVQEVLFKKGENPVGQYIRISGVYFMVVGVREPQSGGQDGQEEAQTIHTPFTTFQSTFNMANKVHVFLCKAKDNIEAETAENEVVEVLKNNHKVAPDDKVAIGHWSAGIEFRKLTGLFTGIEILVWIVGIGTLLAGVIGISNIMLIVVKERTKEIGVKRALGATPANVIVQILLEALFLTAIAGYAGLTFGIYMLEGLNKLIGEGSPNSMFTNPTVDISIALKALSVIIIGGLIAGFIPARRAVSIHPVEALRTE